jgi:Glyoxalase-like domain
LLFDHLIVPARDLDGLAQSMLEEHGLASVPGGRHPGHGTANRIIPLGEDYIELMGVVNRGEAAASPMGRWVSDELDRGRTLLGLSLRVPDADAEARRLNVGVRVLTRARPDGHMLRCRLAGLECSMGSERLPFFIQWEVRPSLHPGRESVKHRSSPRGISWVEIGGDPARLDLWLGPHDLDIRFVEGDPGIRAAGIATRAGEIVLR